jgi:hypothetical protein
MDKASCDGGLQCTDTPREVHTVSSDMPWIQSYKYVLTWILVCDTLVLVWIWPN